MAITLRLHGLTRWSCDGRVNRIRSKWRGHMLERERFSWPSSGFRFFDLIPDRRRARGWLYMDWAWAIRGWMDKAIGGVGIRRGRRHPMIFDRWVVGLLACWSGWKRIGFEIASRNDCAGQAWLQFESIPQEDGKTLLTETAYYSPRGFWVSSTGNAMWPFMPFYLNGLIRRLASRARVLAQT